MKYVTKPRDTNREIVNALLRRAKRFHCSVNGTAEICTDPQLLASFTFADKGTQMKGVIGGTGRFYLSQFGNPMGGGSSSTPVVDINGNSTINGCGGGNSATGSGNLAMVHWTDGR